MEPLRIAVLAGKRAEGLAGLLADPNRGSLWILSIVVGVETELAEMRVLEDAGVPVELRPIRLVPAFRNLRAREEHDEEIADLLARLNVDYVLLAGYPYVATNGLLSRFPGRVLALHDADLSRRDPLYGGPHAVRDAILAGENETRSSMYIVTSDVARGPLFLLGGAYPIAPMARDARERGDAAFLYAYAELHRRWMIETSWSAMLQRALELLAGGTMQIIGDVVWIDGAPGPCRMGESPGTCHDVESMVARGIPRSCPFIG
jgi:phosphoribosylglycinamide formyltransferase-1